MAKNQSPQHNGKKSKKRAQDPKKRTENIQSVLRIATELGRSDKAAKYVDSLGRKRVVATVLVVVRRPECGAIVCRDGGWKNMPRYILPFAAEEGCESSSDSIRERLERDLQAPIAELRFARRTEGHREFRDIYVSVIDDLPNPEVSRSYESERGSVLLVDVMSFDEAAECLCEICLSTFRDALYFLRELNHDEYSSFCIGVEKIVSMRLSNMVADRA